jgi:hypothetical protein
MGRVAMEAGPRYGRAARGMIYEARLGPPGPAPGPAAVARLDRRVERAVRRVERALATPGVDPGPALRDYHAAERRALRADLALRAARRRKNLRRFLEN